MQRLVRLLSLNLLAIVAAGCAARNAGAADDGLVVISVRNPSTVAAEVRVCPPSPCLPPRVIEGGDEAEFRFPPGNGTRAVVDARRGDRVVDQKPVDYRPGERHQVVLEIPESR